MIRRKWCSDHITYSCYEQSRVFFFFVLYRNLDIIPNDRWAGPPVFQRMVQLVFFLSGNLHVRLQVMALLLPWRSFRA